MKNLEILDSCSTVTQEQMKTIIAKLEEIRELEECDYISLTILAKNIELYNIANDDIFKNGLTVTDRFGAQVRNPSINIARDAEAKVISLISEFGLSPKSRKNLKIKKETDTPLTAFLKKKESRNE